MKIKLELEEKDWESFLHFVHVGFRGEKRDDICHELEKQLREHEKISMILTKQQWIQFFNYYQHSVSSDYRPPNYELIRVQFDNACKT